MRHSHPALGGAGTITWLESPVGILHFTREPGLEVVVNTTSAPVKLEVTGIAILLESAEGSSLHDKALTIAADTTVWLQR
ncbi:MAG: hypothetical protein WDN07_00370 [Actinomycetota bacterium]